MSLEQAGNAFDLLGQAITLAEPVRLPTGDGPKLEIGWGSFHQGIGSSIAALLRRSEFSRRLAIPDFFRECWVEENFPRSAVVTAAFLHLLLVAFPFPQFAGTARHYSAFDNTELTWSGPINDLPLLGLRSAKAKPSPRSEPAKPPEQAGTDAYHPRQRIFTDPAHPTHPRQTLVNSAAPAEPPKILPSLPNIVQVQELPGPARPRLQISEQSVARLKPRERRIAAVQVTPLPDVQAPEQKPADIAMPVSSDAPARPKLELNAGAAPRVTARTQTGNESPSPELGVAQSGPANGNAATLIALSATPGPAAPVAPPQGNLAARLSISPDGKGTGSGGGSPGGSSGTGPNSVSGKGSMNISISGGNPPPNNGVSGLGTSTKTGGSQLRLLAGKPDPRMQADDAPVRTGPPDFAALPAGAQPERIFASKKVYKLLVNMPNLNSATGSWILNFSELRTDADGQHTASSDIEGPAPLRKVDPKYPPTLKLERVEGEVILYAVIRRDGAVDSIQLVRGIDEQLDANAMNALSQWKFRPALKQGEPVELEAIVHIPFHIPSEQ